jgi:hypothetical protein
MKVLLDIIRSFCLHDSRETHVGAVKIGEEVDNAARE